MRPLRLKMTAFGPYAQEVILDFAELAENQMFVITGPTGAGKTTIFDAICYALYGDASNKERQSKGLRSDFVAEEAGIITAVELTFMVHNKIYFVRRQPEQRLPSKRGGFKDGKHEVVLQCISHNEFEPLEKIDEVRAKITEILGLNDDQFRKIVMIPQGDFRQFLNADTKEKNEILRKLFGTEFYEQVQQKLKAEKNESKKEYDKYELLLMESLRQFQTEDTILKQQLEQEKPLLTTLFPQMQEAMTVALTENERLKNQLATYQKQAEILTEQLVESKNINQLFAQATQAEHDYQQLLQQESIIVQKRQTIDKIHSAQKLAPFAQSVVIYQNDAAKSQQEQQRLEQLFTQNKIQLSQLEPQMAQLKTEAAKIDVQKEQLLTLKRYREESAQLARLEKEATKLQEENLAAEKQAAFLTEQVQASKKRQQFLQEKLKEMQQKSERENQLALSLQEITHAGKQYNDLLKKAQQFIELHRNQLPKLSSAMQTCQKRWQEQTNYVERLRKQQLEQYSAVLAAQLIDGEPCPVCGATTHLKPQQAPENLVDETELKKQEKSLEQVRLQLTEAEKNLSLTESDLKRLWQEMFADEAKATIPSLKEQFTQWHQAQKDHYAALQAQYRQEKSQQEELKQALLTQSQLRQEEEKLIKQLQRLEETLQNAQQMQQEKKTSAAVAQQSYQETLQRLPEAFRQANTLEQEINLKEQRIAQFQKQFEITSDQLVHCQKEHHQLSGQLAAVSEKYREQQELLHNAQSDFGKALQQYFTDQTEYEQYKNQSHHLERLTEEINHYEKNLAASKMQWENCQKQLAGKTKIDLSQLENQQKQLKERVEQLQQQQNRCQISYEHNQSILNAANNYSNLQKAAEATYQTAARLANLADGDNNQRMNFETFVLLTYFEQVLQEANKRLNKMTGGRYYFRRQQELVSKQRKAGLDIDIMDNYTGKTRAVSTLSGGESFKASLALALGLSDVVQNAAGGIELNTIFIDEGFGTLDSDSLEQTIDCLIELQLGGRLVGIISHVAELKERIKAQLIVTPSEKGSKARFKID